MILIPISDYDNIAESSNKMHANSLLLHQKLDSFENQLDEFYKIKNIVRTVKKQMTSIKDRIKRDGKSIQNNSKKLNLVISEFRQRCRENHLEYLKSIDLDIRRILKSFVSSELVDEYIDYPVININLNESAVFEKPNLVKKEVNPDDLNDMRSHMQTVLTLMNNLVKDLLQILSEANKKYYEIVNPDIIGSRASSPIARELPEYFTFQTEESLDTPPKPAFDKLKLYKVKFRIQLLKEKGEITPKTAELLIDRLDQMQNEGRNDIASIFSYTDIPISKLQEIVFQLINFEKQDSIDLDISDVVDKTPDSKSNSIRLEREDRKLRTPNYAEIKTTERPENDVFDLSYDEKQEKINNTPADTSRVDMMYYTPKSQPSHGRFFKNRASVHFSIVKDPRDEQPAKAPPIKLNKLKVNRTKSDVRVRSTTPKNAKSSPKRIEIKRRASYHNKSML